MKKQPPDSADLPSGTTQNPPAPEPAASPDSIPAPAPTVGYHKGIVMYEPKYIDNCPEGVTNFSVPPCRGPYPNYPVNIRDQSGNVVFNGRTDSSGKITITLPPGNYYWIQNEEDSEDPTKNSSRRSFTIEAGQTGSFVDYFVVFVDVGAAPPVPKSCAELGLEEIAPNVCGPQK